MSEDMNSASNNYLWSKTTDSDFAGMTEAKGNRLTDPVGTTISSAANWLARERLFETTIGHIILLSSLTFLTLGLILGGMAQKSRKDVMYMDGKKYVCAGWAQLKDHDRVLFTPVYEERK